MSSPRRHLSGHLAVLRPRLPFVSSWKVEFARFARMHVVFQFMTLVLLVIVGRILSGGGKAVRWLSC